ncbi:hypothetical protein WDU94_002865 [Cyamophila willieti]
MPVKKISDLTVRELKVVLSRYGANTSGVKATLVLRLRNIATGEGNDPEEVTFDTELKEDDLSHVSGEDEDNEPSNESRTKDGDRLGNSDVAVVQSTGEVVGNGALQEERRDSEGGQVKLESLVQMINQGFMKLETKISLESENQARGMMQLDERITLERQFQERSVQEKLMEYHEEQRAFLNTHLLIIKEEVKEELKNHVQGEMGHIMQGVQDRLLQLEQTVGVQNTRQVHSSTFPVRSLEGTRMKVPSFDGQTSWSVFRKQFEAACETNNYGEQEKATALILALRGPAADLLQNQ